MVEDQITDGKRIAQLLSSELTGLQAGGLEDISVTDADADAMPSDTGTLAYRITSDDEPIAAVSLYPEYAELAFSVPITESVAESVSFAVEDSTAGDDQTVQITSGAAVKEALDLIRETVEARQQF